MMLWTILKNWCLIPGIPNIKKSKLNFHSIRKTELK